MDSMKWKKGDVVEVKETIYNSFSKKIELGKGERVIVLERYGDDQKKDLPMVIARESDPTYILCVADHELCERKSNSPSFLYPKTISEPMIRLADPGDSPSRYTHFAANLNAMLQHGYCAVCGLTPDGCKREGCGEDE